MAGKKFQVIVTVYHTPESLAIPLMFGKFKPKHKIQHMLLDMTFPTRAEADNYASIILQCNDNIKLRAKAVVTG